MDIENRISKVADALDIDIDVDWTNDGKMLVVGQTASGKMFTRLYDVPSDELAARATADRAEQEYKLLSVR